MYYDKKSYGYNMRYKDLSFKLDRSASDIYRFVASTSAPDRYGDVIDQKGWLLGKYKKNPVILLNHNSNALPIGKGDVKLVDGALQVDIEFDMEDPSAAEVARKTKSGYMSAVSVGFNPVDSVPRSQLPKDHTAYGKKGMFFERAELLEVSIVTIPANGDAVAIKNYLSSNTAFKVSRLKHIIDVEMKDDVVIVTYAKHEQMPEEEDAMQEDLPEEEDAMQDKEEEDLPEEEDAMQDKEEEEEKYHDDDDEENKDLTQYERDFLRYLIGD